MDGLPCYQPSSVREEIAQREDAEVRRANGPPDRLAFVVDDIPEGARLAFVTSASLSQRGLMLLSGIVWDPVVTLIDPDKAPVSCFFVASRRPEEDRSFGIVKASCGVATRPRQKQLGFRQPCPPRLGIAKLSFSKCNNLIQIHPIG